MAATCSSVWATSQIWLRLRAPGQVKMLNSQTQKYKVIVDGNFDDISGSYLT